MSEDCTSSPQSISHENEPAQSTNYGTNNHITNATNVITGPNYGTIVQQSSNKAVDFSQLNDFPSHPDISGLLSDYFPKSRVADEEGIWHWINDGRHSELALCVLGRAGVGKSTFARHLSERLQISKQLVAAIFFGFAPPQWGVESAIKVIAHQLGRAHPAAVESISQAIRLYGGPSVPLEVQIKKFILEPIRQLQYPYPLVIVLDALDQWPLHPSLINALPTLTTQASLLRLVILGRPGLQDRFDNVSTAIRKLLDVPNEVMGDYFNSRFDKIHWKIGGKPDKAAITQLVAKADGLFIWTATVCSLLEDEVCCPNPEETLAAILQSRRSVGETDIMATLYHNAIALLFPKTEHKEKLKAYLGAALALQEPLPIAAFAALASMNVSLVKKIHAELSSLQVGRTSTAGSQQMIYPVATTFHLSFLEYLRSAQASTKIALTITPSAHHFQFGKACLEELQRLLSGPRRDYISPLQRYSLRFWPTHTVLGTPPVTAASDAEWRATPHSASLQKMTSAHMAEWAQLFINLIKPGALLGVALDGSSSTVQLLMDISRVLGDAQDDIDLTVHRVPTLEVAVRMQHQDAESWYFLGATYTQYGRNTGLHDSIERAVDACRYANELRRNSSGLEPAMFLSNLALALSNRFDWMGASKDQDEAIQLYHQALSLRPVGHPCRALTLNNLGGCLGGRYKLKGSFNDLEEAIHMHREALYLRPEGHHDRPFSLDSLSYALHTRYLHTGAYGDVDECISLQQEVLSLDVPHAKRSHFLSNLALYLKARFDQKGHADDFDQSIRLYQEALSLQPRGHPDRAHSLNNVGISLWSRFERRGSADDLEQSIVMHQEVLSLWPPGHPQRRIVLNNLAIAIKSRYSISGSIEDLDSSIHLLQEALGLQPIGHLGRPTTINNLGLAFMTRFCHQENLDDLEEAIGMFKEALSSWPIGHPERPQTLNKLGLCLRERFQRSESIEDLDASLETHREALSFHTPGHPGCPQTRQLLNDALFARFERLREIADLEESIKLRREGLEVSPEAHNRVGLAANTNALAWELLSRYDLTGSSNDLEESIGLARRSLELIPTEDDPQRKHSLDTLAMALRHKVEHLAESLSLSREALALEPLNWEHSQSLSIILFACYRRTRDISQLDEAISTSQKALVLCPPHERSRLEALQVELSNFHSPV
ncbi:hypothetical protein BKA70DRAFT_1572891 [Coprinopsis sp. MPI-PUGE-AT-0042]|nr:hypothetical protein BKA70DRAFT_1572891 [Coprinopsis sp. MPI-PUGE-AT-0042]